MVISRARHAIEDAIEGTRADGSYSLQRDGLFDEWTVSPDPMRPLSPRDLMATIRIGGGRLTGPGTWAYEVAIAITLASYSSIRSADSSLEELTAEDRVDGAARHLLTSLPSAIPGLCPIGYSDAIIDPDGLWYSTILTFSLLT